MASDRVIAMKHAQAAEDNASAMKQMADSIKVLEEQNAALIAKLDAVLEQLSAPQMVISAADSTTAIPKPDASKKGR